MKKILILAVIFMCGCAHYTVTNKEYLRPIEPSDGKKNNLHIFPMELKASMECFNEGNVNRCTNKYRIDKVVDILNRRGYEPVKSGSAVRVPHLSVQVEEQSFLSTYFSMVINFSTLGLIPRTGYKKYVVTYSDAEKSINVVEQATVEYSAGWIPLFMFNPEHLSGEEINNRVEWNVINSVFDKANLAQKESVTVN